MAGALDAVVGRCTNLTSLCIATVGDSDERLACMPWDDRRYASWARFLSSVRSQLHSFSFKQGLSRNWDAAPRGYCRPRPKYDSRPMDRLFRQWILPVLLAGTWPRVRRVEIRAVGRSVQERYPDRVPPPGDSYETGIAIEVLEHANTSSSSSSSRYQVRITRVAFYAAAQEQLRRLIPDDAELVIEEEPERDYEELQYGRDDHGICFRPYL